MTFHKKCDLTSEHLLRGSTKEKMMITLFTRDGSRVGNAILHHAEEREYFPDTIVTLFHIETDFGNHMVLTQGELDDMYTIGRHVFYIEWNSERRKRINEPLTRTTKFEGEMWPQQKILDHFGFVPAPIIE